MVGLGDQLIGCLHRCVGLGLQVSPTTLLDFGLTNLVRWWVGIRQVYPSQHSKGGRNE